MEFLIKSIKFNKILIKSFNLINSFNFSQINPSLILPSLMLSRGNDISTPQLK